MKRIILLLVTCFLFSIALPAQHVGFHKEYQVGCGGTIFTGIVEMDSFYMAQGISGDSADCFRARNTMFKIDYDGNILSYVTNPYQETFTPTLQLNSKGNFVTTAYYVDSIGMHGAILEFDSNGVLVDSIIIENASEIGAGIRADDWKIKKNQEKIVICVERDSIINDVYIRVINIDSNSAVKYSKIFSINNNLNDDFPCLQLKDNGVIIGYEQSNTQKVNNNYTIRAIIKQLDSLGNTLWHWQSEDSLQILGVDDMLVSKDKGIVAATGKAVVITATSRDDVYSEGYIFKLDSNQQWAWSRQMPSFYYGYYNRMNRILELADSSLMVFGSATDTLTINGTRITQIMGLIMHLSANGDSLWSRRYQIIGEAGGRHKVVDAKATRDGGYLIAGESFLYPRQPVQQFGWLLKVDANGCLHPNCATPVSLLPDAPERIALRLSPNPASHSLQVNLGIPTALLGKTMQFRIINTQGQVLQLLPARAYADFSYILNVQDLAAGVYFLEVMIEGQSIGAEQFVKL